MKLTNPTDEQLIEAFALKVAGWKRGGMFCQGDAQQPPGWTVHGLTPPLPNGQLPDFHWIADLPRFTESFDAVLPYLNSHAVRIDRYQSSCGDNAEWQVVLDENDNHFGSDPLLPRAAAIALLRAHGVEVEFSPAT